MNPVSTIPWDVRDTDYPLKADVADKWRFLLKYAVLAPSGHNTQPWLFHVDGDTVELRADRSRHLPVVDPAGRELTMSCGAALMHLRVAAARFGLVTEFQPLPEPHDPDLLARVRVTGERPPTEEEVRLFYAITARHTHRLQFSKDEVPPALLARLQAAAGAEGAWLCLVPAGAVRQAVADLVAHGDRTQLKSRAFREELSEWIRAGSGKGGDGMPPSAFGFASAADYVTPLVSLTIRTLDVGKRQAEVDRALALEAPALGVLGTGGDSPRDWLAAGQALARVLLLARSESLWTSFLNQPVEVEVLRRMLRGVLNTPGLPQLVLRMGYVRDAVPQPTSRRSVADVLR
jgi:Nitroreductase family